MTCDAIREVLRCPHPTFDHRALEPPNLPIRDLAYRELKRLLPEMTASIDYDPTAPEKQRQQAVEQWKKKLPPGKLPPRPAPPGVK